MAYDLEEQDQLDALKTWWKTYGNLVSNIVLVLALAFVAYRGWDYYQGKQAVEASSKYETLTQMDEKDSKAIKALAAEIMDQYSGTPYAGRAALLAAKTNYQVAKDIKSAQAQLEWAAEHAKEDAIKALALLQLAAIQYDAKQYDQALATLAKPHDAAFEGLYLDLKGDVLLATGKKAEAKEAYKQALSKLDAQGSMLKITKIKLESLGG